MSTPIHEEEVRMTIVVSDEVKILDSIVSTIDSGSLDNIKECIDNSLAARIENSKSFAKKLKNQRASRDIISELLVSPSGLSAKEILDISEFENLSSIILCVRNYMKKSEEYTNYDLKKFKKNKETYYKLVYVSKRVVGHDVSIVDLP